MNNYQTGSNVVQYPQLSYAKSGDRDRSLDKKFKIIFLEHDKF